MTTAQVVEMSVTLNNNSPIQDYINPDDQTQPTFDISVWWKVRERAGDLQADKNNFKCINFGNRVLSHPLAQN